MNSTIDKRFANVKRSKTFGNILRRFDLGNKKVLDVGCSYGEHLANFGAGSVGLTISAEEAEYGKAQGLDIRLGNIEGEVVQIEGQFDVIFANNILEHLFSPHHFLVEIKNYLAPEGLLILGVPCVPRFTSLTILAKFRGSLAASHINFFTRYSLVKTVERAGWYVLSARSFHFASPILDK